MDTVRLSCKQEAPGSNPGSGSEKLLVIGLSLLPDGRKVPGIATGVATTHLATIMGEASTMTKKPAVWLVLNAGCKGRLS